MRSGPEPDLKDRLGCFAQFMAEMIHRKSFTQTDERTRNVRRNFSSEPPHGASGNMSEIMITRKDMKISALQDQDGHYDPRQIEGRFVRQTL